MHTFLLLFVKPVTKSILFALLYYLDWSRVAWIVN